MFENWFSSHQEQPKRNEIKPPSKKSWAWEPYYQYNRTDGSDPERLFVGIEDEEGKYYVWSVQERYKYVDLKCELGALMNGNVYPTEIGIGIYWGKITDNPYILKAAKLLKISDPKLFVERLNNWQVVPHVVTQDDVDEFRSRVPASLTIRLFKKAIRLAKEDIRKNDPRRFAEYKDWKKRQDEVDQ